MKIEIEKHSVIEHISYSQLTTWLLCGWQYYLGRVLKLPEEESVWSVGGSAYHKACEMWDLEQMS
jgi:hypothetical protein